MPVLKFASSMAPIKLNQQKLEAAQKLLDSDQDMDYKPTRNINYFMN